MSRDITFEPYGMNFQDRLQAEQEIADHGHYSPKTKKLSRRQPTCVKQAIEFLKTHSNDNSR